MADEIKISPEQIDSAISQMNTVIDSLTESVQRLEKKDQHLVERWKGSGGDAFLKAAVTSEQLYNNTITIIKERVHFLEEAKRIMNETDEEISVS